APTIGIDWMITRTHGGLYVSGSQTFFSQHTFTLRDPVSVDSGKRPILIKNLRRLDVLLAGFPGEHLKFHPYVACGLSVGQVASAQAQGTFSNEDQLLFANAVIQEERVAVSPMLMVGAQWRLKRASAFGQFTASPAQKRFIMYNGRPFNFVYEVGLR